MFVRFVRLRVREGRESAFADWYRARVIPALSAMQGCVFAGLLTPWRSEEHRSLTIWRTTSAAAAYERGGLYRELLREAAPMLVAGTEWTAPPDQPDAGQTDAEIREIPPEGFVIDAGDGAPVRLGKEFDTAFVRIVAVRLDPDRIGEFVTAYSNRILPTLRAQKGFRGGFLAEDREEEGDCLSITLWEREEDATRYEMSGAFAQLTEEVMDTFSPIYTWQKPRTSSKEDRDPRLDAPRVSSYLLVMGKRLGEDDR